MSGGKVTIGGTNYKIIGGKTTIGGTGYSIPRGKTLAGGTGYKIQLFPLDLLHLLTHADWAGGAGRDASTAATIGFNQNEFAYGAGTYYLFSTYGVFMGIHKIIYNGSKVTSHKMLAGHNYGNIYVNSAGTNVYYARSASATAGFSTTSAGLNLYQFRGYTEAEVDSILSAVTITRLAARRDQTTTATVTVNTSDLIGKIAWAATGEELSFTYVTAYNNYKVLQTSNLGRSLLYMTSSTAGISKNGTSNTAVYGGGIGTIA